MIVGIGHRKRVGKDTFAKMLRANLARTLGEDAVKLTGFAHKLKDICHQLYGWAGLENAQFYEDHPEMREVVLPFIDKTPRQIWIDMGTPAVRQNVYDRTWIDYLLKNPRPPVLIVSDLRFPNEAEAVKFHGGVLIRVDRDEVPHSDDIADVALAGFEGWDFIIENNGSLHGLACDAEFIARVIASSC